MIQIDMEMPEDCIDCPIHNDEFLCCNLEPDIKDWDGFDGRPEWCPLVEVKNENN